MTTENIPEADGEIFLGNYKFIIEEVTNTRIEVIKLIIETEEEDSEDSEQEES